MRRMMLEQEEEEVKEWTVLEDTVLEEACKWNKTYDENYGEYMCYIELPKVEAKITTTNSMILGSAETYYTAVGDTNYKYAIYVKTKKIKDNFILCESARNALSGVTESLKVGVRKLDSLSTKISLSFELPVSTQIFVLAR